MDAHTFAALGEPSRLQIVELLRERPFSVSDVAEALTIRQPQVSKHLRVLREAGIVAAEPVARQRIHHLQAAPFERIGSWVDSFEGLWEVRLDSLDTFLRSMGGTRGEVDHREEGRRGRHA
jgi:DNA-binding transcriptional ArsR family regulator